MNRCCKGFLFFLTGFACFFPSGGMEVELKAREGALFLYSSDSLYGLTATEWVGEAPAVDVDTAGEITRATSREAALSKFILGGDVTALQLKLARCTGEADLGESRVKTLILKTRGGRFSVKAGSHVDRFDLSAAGGRVTLDLRRQYQGTAGQIHAAAARVTVIFPAGARVRVKPALSALNLLSGKGFETVEGDFVREGPGPEFEINVTGSLSRVNFRTAGEDDDDGETKTLALTAPDPLSPFLRYNRVEGLFWGMGIDTRKRSRAPSGLLLDVGYAVTPRIVQFGMGAALRLFDRPAPMNLYLLHYKKIESEDDNVMRAGENSLHSFFFGQDFRDYYLNKSSLLKGDWTLRRDVTLFGSLGKAIYYPLPAANPFHLFGDTIFRVNPPVRAGDDHFIRAGVAVKKHGDVFPRRGFFARSEAEYSGGAIRSEFTYRKLSAEGRGFAALSRGTEFAGRLFAGELTGKHGFAGFAPQKLFDLGGPGTVRGVPFRADTALLDKNRMVTLTLEIKQRGELPPGWEAPFAGSFLDPLLFIVFFDAGSAWNTEDAGRSNESFNNPWTEVKLRDLRKTFGAGIAFRDESFRLDVMRHSPPGDRESFDSILLRFRRAL